MKRTFFTILLISLLSFPLMAQNEPSSAQQVAPKVPQELITSPDNPILLMFTASWCAPCHRMRENVFPSPEVAPLLKKYNLVMIDIDTPAGSAIEQQFCSERVVPYFFILDKDQNKIAEQKGAVDSPAAFAAFLSAGLPKDGKIGDAVSGEKFSAMTGDNYKAALTASSDAIRSHWTAGVEIGAGMRNLTTLYPNWRFDYLVALYGRVTSYGGTAFQAGLQYEPLTGLSIPLDLSFRIVKGLNLGAGVAPSVLMQKGDTRPANGYELRNFDVNFRFRMGYQIEKVRVGVMYSIGGANQIKDQLLVKSHNNILALTLSYDVL